jgi:hypothetical protein
MNARSPAATLVATFAIRGQPPKSLHLSCQALVDGHSVTRRLARAFPSIAADLIEIAARIYAIDRLVERPTDPALRSGSSWGRDLRVEMPVRSPRLWNNHVDRLTELLAWLTDDSWSLEFSRLSEGAGPLDESQGYLFEMVPRGSIPVLFSGGLDSAAGLAVGLADSDVVAISVDTNNWMQHVQQRVLKELRALYPRECVPLRYRVSVGASGVESSQRSRGLLFLAVGIATSWALRQNRLRVFENGIGAINLPYLRSQFGSQATRSMHPRTLWLAEQLAAAVGSRPFRIETPTLAATKAQVVSAAPISADSALALTVSCDTGFAARVRQHAPCGICTSCLLRRQALHAAGKANLDAAASYRASAPERSVAFQAMMWQVARLRTCLAQPDPWIAMVSEFPELLDTAPLAPTDVVSLYRSYVREWQGLHTTSWTSGQLERGGEGAL